MKRRGNHGLFSTDMCFILTLVNPTFKLLRQNNNLSMFYDRDQIELKSF